MYPCECACCINFVTFHLDVLSFNVTHIYVKDDDDDDDDHDDDDDVEQFLFLVYSSRKYISQCFLWTFLKPFQSSVACVSHACITTHAHPPCIAHKLSGLALGSD